MEGWFLNNPTKIKDLLRVPLKLAGIEAENISCTMIIRRGIIVEEAVIDSLDEFIKLYPLAEAIVIEATKPKITVREEFKVNSLLITLRKLNEEWEPRIYIEEQEIPKEFYRRWVQIVKERGEDILKKILILAEFLTIIYRLFS